MENKPIMIEIPAYDAPWLLKLLDLVNDSKGNIPHDKRELIKAKVKEIKELIEKFDSPIDHYAPSPKVEEPQPFSGSSYRSFND